MDASVVYDGNMDNYTPAKRRIDLALENGRGVEIRYVFRDAEEAYRNGVLPRGENEGGRTVTTQGHVDTHTGSLETVQRIAEEYKNNPDVKIKVFENSPNGLVERPIDFLNEKGYDKDILKQNLTNITNDEYNKGNISNRTHEAALRSRSGEDTRVGESSGQNRPSEHQSDSEIVARKTSGEGNSAEDEIVKPKIRTVGGPKAVEGTGEFSNFKLSKRVKAATVENGLADSLGDLPGSKSIDMKDQAKKVADFINENPDDAKSVAMGEKNAPKGILPMAVYKAFTDLALEDGGLNCSIAMNLKTKLNRY